MDSVLGVQYDGGGTCFVYGTEKATEATSHPDRQIVASIFETVFMIPLAPDDFFVLSLLINIQ